jgi:hypothetical protein
MIKYEPRWRSLIITILILNTLYLFNPFAQAMELLHVSKRNPRYFETEKGNLVYLTGSHTWANFQERGFEGLSADFDYDEYLNFLDTHNHNFIRLWVWEHSLWMHNTSKKIRYKPLAYIRKGPGKALDGQPKFDLTQFNQNYFGRLHRRVSEARKRGIYVSVMLFQGFSVEQKPVSDTVSEKENPWNGHPFNKHNNINGINGDLDGDGNGREVHTLADEAITKLQEAYIRKVIDTLNGLDNVLWEVSNESHSGSTQWQYHIINFIKQYESTKPKQHPVGMTAQWPDGNNKTLFGSPADWISPGKGDGYLEDPPASDGCKVIIADTDHLNPYLYDPRWAWKSFFRGLNPIMMDKYKDAKFYPEGIRQPEAKWNPLRKSLGVSLKIAYMINLEDMKPDTTIASSGYCLTNNNPEAPKYLIYVPKTDRICGNCGALAKLKSAIKHIGSLASKSTVDIDLAGTNQNLKVAWLDPLTGKIEKAGSITGGRRITFIAPSKDDAILHLYAN